MKIARSPLAVLPLVLASACGGGGAGAPAAPVAGQASPAPFAPAFPGVTGELAAITGSTLQVQGASSQTGVTYTSATTITSTLPATASDVAAGLCVTVRTAALPSASPASPGTQPTSVTAGTVVLSQPVNGTCRSRGPAGLPGFGGPRASGRPRPSGLPGGGPGGGAGRRGGFGVTGKVVSVAGGTFVVASSRLPRGAVPEPSTASSGPLPVTNVTVTTTTATRWTKTVVVTPAAFVVGVCVTALGSADDTGTVAATAIALRPKQDGTCLSGFGPRVGGTNG